MSEIVVCDASLFFKIHPLEPRSAQISGKKQERDKTFVIRHRASKGAVIVVLLSLSQDICARKFQQEELQWAWLVSFRVPT